MNSAPQSPTTSHTNPQTPTSDTDDVLNVSHSSACNTARKLARIASQVAFDDALSNNTGNANESHDEGDYMTFGDGRGLGLQDARFARSEEFSIDHSQDDNIWTQEALYSDSRGVSSISAGAKSTDEVATFSTLATGHRKCAVCPLRPSSTNSSYRLLSRHKSPVPAALYGVDTWAGGRKTMWQTRTLKGIVSPYLQDPRRTYATHKC